jgi:choline dehydrogenase-like flavoprotein
VQSGTVTGDGIDFALHADDWRRLVKGLRLAATAMFAAGAVEVMDTRFSARSMRSAAEIDGYYADVGPRTFLKLEAAHLVGGNVIHDDPQKGVVDQSHRVHGMDNLWICDASVMPTAITLNIQYTVMALARRAALRLARS